VRPSKDSQQGHCVHDHLPRFAPQRGYARHQLLSHALSDHYYDSRANVRKKVAVILSLLRRNAPDMPMAALEDLLTSMPQGPQKLALILSQEDKQLMAMDRYERRALLRRKFAIRAFDEARRSSR
jgi:hypothetical protein